MNRYDFMFDEAFEYEKRQSNVESQDTGSKAIDNQTRLPPLGACSNELSVGVADSHMKDDYERLVELELQHEQLNASLYALTSHFAQVQFRLKQIISGPRDDQEDLLHELEEFAFTGCPDVAGPNDRKLPCKTCSAHSAVEQYEQRIAAEKARQVKLADHLKSMISDLEKYQLEEQSRHKVVTKKRDASKVGSRSSSFVVEQLGEQLGVDPSRISVTKEQDLKEHVDKAMSKLLNPGKAKETIVQQLSKQIQDMEKFLTFLRGYESSAETDAEPEERDRLRGTYTRQNTSERLKAPSASSPPGAKSEDLESHAKLMQLSEERRKRIQDASIAMMKKALSVLQIFAISQFGCSARHFHEHMSRKAAMKNASNAGYTAPLSHLHACIDKIISLHNHLTDMGGLHPDSEDELNMPMSTADKRASWHRSASVSTDRSRCPSRASSVSSDVSAATHSSGKPIELFVQEELIKIVRGDFADALKDLMQHGLYESFPSRALTTQALVGCISPRGRSGTGGLHAWEYFDKFYMLKQGHLFNTQPGAMLSEAFGMDMGCTQQTPKQSLLTVLHRIKGTHEPRKRSFDAMFKALVSAGLNRGRLAQWIRLVIRCPELVNHHYERWSYVIRSGFDEVLNLLEKLSQLTFFLPEDLAIRHLMKSQNEFGDL